MPPGVYDELLLLKKLIVTYVCCMQHGRMTLQLNL